MKKFNHFLTYLVMPFVPFIGLAYIRLLSYYKVNHIAIVMQTLYFLAILIILVAFVLGEFTDFIKGFYIS